MQAHANGIVVCINPARIEISCMAIYNHLSDILGTQRSLFSKSHYKSRYLNHLFTPTVISKINNLRAKLNQISRFTPPIVNLC